MKNGQPVPKEPRLRGGDEETGWHSVICLTRQEFSGDDDRRIKGIQNESYPFLISALYEETRARVLAGGHEPHALRKARETAELDRPLLRKAYQKIAAYFRFARHRGPQLPLPFDDLEYEDVLRVAWEEYFRREARVLTKDADIARAVVFSVSTEDSASARASEAHLVDLLDQRYGRFSLERRLELLGEPVDREEIASWPGASEPELGDILRPGPDPDQNDSQLHY